MGKNRGLMPPPKQGGPAVCVTSVRLSPEFRARLKEVAAATGHNQATVIRHFLEWAVTQYEEEAQKKQGRKAK